jgi:hypothetical protein
MSCPSLHVCETSRACLGTILEQSRAKLPGPRYCAPKGTLCLLSSVNGQIEDRLCSEAVQLRFEEPLSRPSSLRESALASVECLLRPAGQRNACSIPATKGSVSPS